VVDRRGLRREGRDDPGDLRGVGLGGLHPLLRLDDARGGDELHRAVIFFVDFTDRMRRR
jgi:hypothetical protein